MKVSAEIELSLEKTDSNINKFKKFLKSKKQDFSEAFSDTNEEVQKIRNQVDEGLEKLKNASKEEVEVIKLDIRQKLDHLNHKINKALR